MVATIGRPGTSAARERRKRSKKNPLRLLPCDGTAERLAGLGEGSASLAIDGVAPRVSRSKVVPRPEAAGNAMRQCTARFSLCTESP